MNPLASFKTMMRRLASQLGQPIAGPDTDPMRWLNTLMALPNPDPILREMGRAELVHRSIAADPHVLGDIRSIRGNHRSHQSRIVAGDEGDSKSVQAQALCQDWMQRNRPNHLADWPEVHWQMSSAFLTGYRAHELVWAVQDGKYLPEQVLDRPGRRFKFDALGQPMLVSRGTPMGAVVEDPYRFVVSRHMADMDNPYGVAVLSACFWVWTFKTGGWRTFVKYCERHGLPWPVGRYPMGTDDKEIDRFEAALANMLEASYVVTQEGNGLELLVPSGSGAGALPQRELIALANRELSKALTGQAMVAELDGAGARAASETALKRQESIDDSVRDIAAASMGEIFRWITLFNFGDGVAPPTLEFFKQENAGADRAGVYEMAQKLGARPSRKAFLEEIGIPEADPQDADDAFPGDAQEGAAAAGRAQAGGGQSRATQAGTMPGDPEAGAEAAGELTLAMALRRVPGFEFARAGGMTEAEAMELAAAAADRAIEDRMIEPVARMLADYEAKGRSLAEFAADLRAIVGEMDDEGLREVLDRSFSYHVLAGAASNAA